MFISRIVLKNWKNFSSVDVECDARVFIIGPNAAGKSNFLDALRFLKDVSQHGLKTAVEIRGGLTSIRYIGARRPSEITLAIELTAGESDEGKKWFYELTFGGKGNNAPLITRETVRKDKSIVIERPDDDDKADSPRLQQTALEQINANKKFRAIPAFLGTIQYRHILPQLVREPKAFSPQNLQDNDPYGRDLVYAIWKTPSKTRDSRLRKINEALRVAVPNLRALSVEQDRNGIPHFKTNHEHWRKNGIYQYESSFSDGTLRFLALLWSLLDSAGPLLLEEPELSLNEDIVARLPSLFSGIEKGRKKVARQIFVTTHAAALLRDPGIGAGEILLLNPNDGGVNVRPPTEPERAAMASNLTPADVLLPEIAPKNIDQLSDFS